MYRYLGGNNIESVLNRCSKLIKNNKIPIINYAIEENNLKNNVYDEYKNLIKNMNNKYKIALKLSSFDFDYNLLNNLINLSNDKKIQIIIDAEKNIDNDKYHKISNELIYNNNKDYPNIIKTYQMYRKDSYNALKDDIIFFKNHNIHLGTKLVRGAYWNSENKDGHLYINKNDTDENYNKSIIYLSNKLSKNYNILATHNKESINLGYILNNYNDKKIFDFAHLMGMGENNYNNFQVKNNIHVYIPYGPYKKMLPYLLRRLYENIDNIKYMY